MRKEESLYRLNLLYIQHNPKINTSRVAIHTSAIPFLTGVQSLASDKATGKPKHSDNIIYSLKLM